MAFWLARERDGQQSDFIQRFDARFWTIDFPRPMMACVYTTGVDSLRADLEFHHKDALAGLIWDSVDTLDHPLLAYDTDRDYSRTTLAFRWQSDGILPLDAVHGPTLTIEGRDEAGTARSWYVRLWNYATGSPQDAQVVIPFSDLAGGWDIQSAPDPVHPFDIDRMFISLAPPEYDPADDGLLTARTNGWVELSEINCDGDRALLEIGDVMVPPHAIRMATAYDDSYNQTPTRLIRNIRGLGYRDEILHYVGMSHYPRLAPTTNGELKVEIPGKLCEPATIWHEQFFAQCGAHGYDAIASLSFELFAEFCPDEWFQRAHDGSPALTGWVPPSTLLTHTNSQVSFFLLLIAGHFAEIQQDAGIPVKFQLGEPWWWVNSEGAPCIYDDSARASFSNAAPDIVDMRQPLTEDQKSVLANGGGKLGIATRVVRNYILDTFAGSEVYVLVFTPTIFDPDMPDMPALNLPNVWKNGHYDRLQVEDYDWLTTGAEALRKQAYGTLQTKLNYPLDQQDYLSGFVLNAEDAETLWPLIDAGLDEAAERGIPRLFVWALPQICRDGYTRTGPGPNGGSGDGSSEEPGEEPSENPEEEEEEMDAFDDVLYPLALGRDAAVSPEFSTAISLTASGHERRNSQWSDARLSFDVGPGLRSENELGTLIEFFRARRGAARGFRLSDPFDFSSNEMTGMPTISDQNIGSGDGLKATFQLQKTYGDIAEPQIRPITRPRAGTILVAIDGVAETGWNLEDGGKIVFDQAPADEAVVTAGFLFDVPVRFSVDRLDVAGASFAAGEAPSVPLIEIREAV